VLEINDIINYPIKEGIIPEVMSSINMYLTGSLHMLFGNKAYKNKWLEKIDNLIFTLSHPLMDLYFFGDVVNW